MISISLNYAQSKALELMNVDANDLATSAVSSAIKGKLNYYINGATVKDVSESTHSVVKVRKDGTKKTVYYKGGLRAGAVQAYQMAKQFLPADMTETQFVSSAIAEATSVMSQLDGGADNEDENDNE